MSDVRVVHFSAFDNLMLCGAPSIGNTSGYPAWTIDDEFVHAAVGDEVVVTCVECHRVFMRDPVGYHRRKNDGMIAAAQKAVAGGFLGMQSIVNSGLKRRDWLDRTYPQTVELPNE